MSSDSKRKNKTNNTSKPPRSKGPQEKKLEGIYSNARFIHIAASLVGHVVQLQVKSGAIFEGVFRTLSSELDVALEVVHKVDRKNIHITNLGTSVSTLLSTLDTQDKPIDFMVFKLLDIVMLTAINVDLDYATRDSFTDTAISKFNGQVLERKLEPWDDNAPDTDGLSGLEETEGDDANGWDVNEMFKTNAEKYGVTSSYNSDLPEYTVPLEPKNTDEYKQQEAKASKIAQEIESSVVYKKRLDLENGDEEDKFSAVVRPSDNTSQRFGTQRKKHQIGGTKPIRGTPSPSSLHGSRSSHSPLGPSSYSHPHKSSASVSSSSLSTSSASVAGNKVVSATQPSTGISSHLPHHPHHHPPPPHHHPPTQAHVSPVVSRQQEVNEPRLNGAAKLEKEEKVSPSVPSIDNKALGDTNNVVEETVNQDLPSRPGEKRDTERKGPVQKGREEQIEELKKFSTSFKLSDENKEAKEEGQEIRTCLVLENESNKEKEELESAKEKENFEESEKIKKSNLNPNAKEFVFNPNAKVFTPRTQLSIPTPPGPAQVQPARMQSPSPLVSVQQQQLVHQSVGQHHIFTVAAPQYVMQPTPVSMSLTPPFSSVSQNRFRKATMPLMQARPEMSPSVHVAAATGQPILAPAAPPPLMVQYTPTQGMMQAGHPQPAMAYPQVYPMVGHRVMSPQPVGMVATTHASYGDTSHIPTQVYMSHQSAAAAAAALQASLQPSHHAVPVSVASMMSQGNAGPPPGHHSNPPTPQSQTPATPVHQHGTPGQTPTPTPQPVMYHSGLTPQPPPMQQQASTPTSQSHHIPHPPNFGGAGTPQSVVIMPGGPSPHSGGGGPPPPHALQGHPLHGHPPGSAAGAAGTPPHVLQHGGMTVIPTSGAMVHTPTQLATTHFVHHQVFPRLFTPGV